ncbi:MAG: DsrH/TusB family sulfur metabolism protein [Nitrospirota bacterium]|jgi:sulfur relay protein TusB/DsrH
MASYLILISNAPDTKNFNRAFSTAGSLRDDENDVSLFFIQDGVRAAIDRDRLIKRELDKLINSGVKCYALDEDLRLRGFEKGMLLPEIIPTGYSELLDLMAAEGVSTIGAF